MKRITRRVILGVLTVFGLVVLGVVAWAFSARNMGELEIWHTTELPSQFTHQDIKAMTGLEDYLRREDRLFSDLNSLVYEQTAAASPLSLNRYHAGSATDPTDFPQNYNRSFQLEPSGATRCGVLLVHGLTDSPYSMRHLAQTYVDEGCYALVLRMPGHGTTPAGLARADWQDWRAAVALGAAAVRQRIGDSGPLFLAGYSNGGALVLGHALDALDDDQLVPVNGLMLFSPMIGVTPFSRVSGLGSVLTYLKFFEQFAWFDILPEFDPYKYNSFPKNAGYQTFLVTGALRERLQALQDEGRLDEIPPVLTFQSLVDATVSTPAVVNELYARVRAPDSELVLFDLNRSSSLAPFLKVDHRQFVEALLVGDKLTYGVTLVGNIASDSALVGSRHRSALQDEIVITSLDRVWPKATYSLSHLAVVFPPEDEFYGTAEASAAAGVLNLGSLNPRGEKGVTSVPVSTLVRLRHNPFYDYLAQRVRADISRYLQP